MRLRARFARSLRESPREGGIANTGHNPDSSDELIALCKKETSAERSEVLNALTSEHLMESFARAMSLCKSVAWKKRYLEYGLPKSVIQARFDAMVESVKADLVGLDLSDAERTHDVRKRAKRVRYVAERAKNVLGKDAVKVAKNMNVHQDDLLKEKGLEEEARKAMEAAMEKVAQPTGSNQQIPKSLTSMTSKALAVVAVAKKSW